MTVARSSGGIAICYVTFGFIDDVIFAYLHIYVFA